MPTAKASSQETATPETNAIPSTENAAPVATAVETTQVVTPEVPKPKVVTAKRSVRPEDKFRFIKGAEFKGKKGFAGVYLLVKMHNGQLGYISTDMWSFDEIEEHVTPAVEKFGVKIPELTYLVLTKPYKLSYQEMPDGQDGEMMALIVRADSELEQK